MHMGPVFLVETASTALIDDSVGQRSPPAPPTEALIGAATLPDACAGSARTRQNVRPRRRSVYASRGVGVRKTAGQSQDRRGERVRRYLSASDSDHPAGHGRELTIGTIDPEQTGGFHGFRPSPSDIIGAGATRQRHGDAVAKAPSAKGPSLS
jgi:hypothetical protein